MGRLSVSTIKDPEFINLQPLDINPLMSSCEIKVLYIGQNRNRSFISKEVALEMSKTLRGCPIVGWFKEDKEDFADHGEKITIDGDGIKFECMTKPYGFVAPDAKVWFQEFEDTDDFGNKVVREYLMTTGYIWDGQYKEAESVIKNGKPHSMELDGDSLEGRWATDSKSGMEFFIINDAIFSKLCILGDDVEPCFEGSSVTAPEVSKSFAFVDSDFQKNLYTMMQELNFALQGGKEEMEENKITEYSENKDSKDEEKDFKKEDENKEEDKKEEKVEDKEDKEEKKDDDDRYALIEEKFSELENNYSLLKAEYEKLLSFKSSVEEKEKDELINKFYMLSEEDKKDVIENKAKYSLEEIESKLSVICFRKKINFSLEDDSTEDGDNTVNNESPVTTFNLETNETIPAWVSAVMNTRNSKNN